MALQDILQAISAQADEQIKRERSAHQNRVSQIREESERRNAKNKQNIAAKKEQRKEQMSIKAHAHSTMMQRNAELKKKQELLDSLYGLVTKELAAMPEKDAEELLKSYLKSITINGEIHPSEAHASILKKIAPSEQFTIGTPIKSVGGFIFTSDHEEHDCSFEHLVASYLRPQTEVKAAKALFSA